MNAREHRWIVICPEGDSTHPSSLTSDAANAPSPYWVLNGDDAQTIRRARSAVHPERICIVIERDHRRYWWPLASFVPPVNLLVQPCYRGTAVAILFSILNILDRDPFARILFVSTKHSCESEASASFALSRAIGELSSDTLELLLVCLRAEHPASDRGYIVPGARLQHGIYKVREFIEKPASTLSQRLCEHGAFRSTSMFSAWGFSILALLREHLPVIVDAMTSALALAAAPSQRIAVLAELYERLPMMDFSQAVLQKSRSMIQLIDASAPPVAHRRAAGSLRGCVSTHDRLPRNEGSKTRAVDQFAYTRSHSDTIVRSTRDDMSDGMGG